MEVYGTTAVGAYQPNRPTESNNGWEAEEKKITRLIKDLSDGDPFVREKAAADLMEFSKSDASSNLKNTIIEPLVASFQGAHKEVQRSALLTFGFLAASGIFTTSSVNSVIKALQNKDETLRRCGAIAAGEFLKSETVPLSVKLIMLPPLIVTLQDTSPVIRRIAAAAIGEFTGMKLPGSSKTEMIEPLIKALKEEKDWDVQYELLAAFGNLAASEIPRTSKLQLLSALTEMSQKDENILEKSAPVFVSFALQPDLRLPKAEFEEKYIIPSILAGLKSEKELARLTAGLALETCLENAASIVKLYSKSKSLERKTAVQSRMDFLKKMEAAPLPSEFKAKIKEFSEKLREELKHSD